MPTDWLFYWMTLPTGLLVIGAAVALPFFLWRALLGGSFRLYGYKPLAMAYLMAGLGLILNNFVSSYIEFSARVTNGILQEVERWSIVPGWTVYVSTLALIIVLPLLGFVAVPTSALLLKAGRLTRTSISLTIVVTWIVLSLAGWATPSNNWHQTHRWESLRGWLAEVFVPIVLVAGPFLLSIHYFGGQRREA